MSESLKDGFLPLWNPYINYGIPQYGDMSSGFWSPITWFIAYTAGYNAFTFTIEEALYIFLAGVGMFKLSGYWRLSKNTRLMSGLAYMCSGYLVGHLQHFNWISGAAFLPFCMFYYLILFQSFNRMTLIKAGVFFSLFLTSAHPGIIIGSLYFFLLLGSGLLYNTIIHKRSASSARKIALQHLFLLTAILISSVGTIIGYWEILPYIDRGDKLFLSDSMSESTTFQSWVSLLLPFSTTKNNDLFATDISMRNCYIGMLFCFIFLYGLINRKTKWQKLLLALAALFFLLSSGGIFKEFLHKFLPFIGYVRLNGEFRIFTIACLIIFSTIELEKLKKEVNTVKLTTLYYVFIAVLSSLIILAGYNMVATKQSIFSHLNENIVLSRSFLKLFVKHISFYDTLVLQGIIQLFFLSLFYKYLCQRKYRLLLLFFCAELCTTTLMNIPYTGVGSASTKEVQTLLEKSPQGIVIPDLAPTSQNPSISLKHKHMIGDWSFYSKQIGTQGWVPYPTTLKNTLSFFNTEKFDEITNKPFIYFKDATNGDMLNIKSFTPTSLSLYASTSQNKFLIVKQNFYPYWECFVNSRQIPTTIEAQTFMKIPLTKGGNTVRLTFSNKKINIAMAFQLTIFMISLIVVATHLIIKNSQGLLSVNRGQ